jgi:hypothetical protein
MDEKTDRFNIRLAGFPIELQTRFSYTRRMCEDYLTQEPAEIRVQITEEDIRQEQTRSIREAMFEGLQPVIYPDGYLESVAAYRKIADQLPERHCAVFHGAVVAVDGVAYAFTASSGTGKTTHMNLWLAHFGPRALVVNGDKPILKLDGGVAYACGTPWSGKEKLNTNTILPLKAICVLERDSTNHIEPISMSQALPTLVQQIYRPEDAAAMRATMIFMRELGSAVKLYRLGCNMEQEAAVVAYTGMNA